MSKPLEMSRENVFNEATLNSLTLKEIIRYAEHMPRETLLSALKNYITEADISETICDYVCDNGNSVNTAHANDILSFLDEITDIEDLEFFGKALTNKVDNLNSHALTRYIADLLKDQEHDSVYLFDFGCGEGDIQDLDGFEKAAQEWAEEHYTLTKKVTANAS